VVAAWYEGDETVTEGLLPNIIGTVDGTINRTSDFEKHEQSIDRLQAKHTCRRALLKAQSSKVGWQTIRKI
jgi:hypothetical protein